MLSLIASLTPFSDYNQSPPNMYQCQMAKQTMGTPAHNPKHRTDNKMYRIMTPQRPIVRCEAQAAYSMDDYPNGTNAVVAVISYTGYDMEDAMIINKGAYDRGFKAGTVYKTKIIELNERGKAEDRFDNEGAAEDRSGAHDSTRTGCPDQASAEEGDVFARSVNTTTPRAIPSPQSQSLRRCTACAFSALPKTAAISAPTMASPASASRLE